MSPFPIVLFAMFAAQIGAPCRPSSTGTSTHIQFMTPQDVRSPDCRWLLEVRGTFTAGDEFGEVTVRPAADADEARRLLFRFQRDAVLSWRSDGRILVVGNQRGPLYSELMSFDLARAVQSPAEVLEIDGVVKTDVERRIAPGHHLETYIPQFVAWADSDAIILVDAASSRGTVGSLTGYCFAYRVAVSPRVKLVSQLTRTEVARYGGSCPEPPRPRARLTGSAQARCTFPGTTNVCRSPDGGWRLRWREATRTSPHLLLREGGGGGGAITLLEFQRSIDIFWAPKGRYLAVTDHSGSSDSTVLVVELESGVVVNVEGAMNSTLKSYSLIHANGHRYFSVIRWQSSTRLLFGVHAYDAQPGHEVRATFLFDAKSRAVKQLN